MTPLFCMDIRCPRSERRGIDAVVSFHFDGNLETVAVDKITRIVAASMISPSDSVTGLAAPISSAAFASPMNTNRKCKTQAPSIMRQPV